MLVRGPPKYFLFTYSHLVCSLLWTPFDPPYRISYDVCRVGLCQNLPVSIPVRSMPTLLSIFSVLIREANLLLTRQWCFEMINQTLRGCTMFRLWHLTSEFLISGFWVRFITTPRHFLLEHLPPYCSCLYVQLLTYSSVGIAAAPPTSSVEAISTPSSVHSLDGGVHSDD